MIKIILGECGQQAALGKRLLMARSRHPVCNGMGCSIMIGLSPALRLDRYCESSHVWLLTPGPDPDALIIMYVFYLSQSYPLQISLTVGIMSPTGRRAGDCQMNIVPDAVPPLAIRVYPRYSLRWASVLRYNLQGARTRDGSCHFVPSRIPQRDSVRSGHNVHPRLGSVYASYSYDLIERWSS